MLRRTNSGQALIVAVAFTALLSGACLLVFNVGQTVYDKMRLPPPTALPCGRPAV